MKDLASQLKQVKTVAIDGHVKPDGDCVGSCLATYNYIAAWFPQIEVDLYLEPIPNIFKFLKQKRKSLLQCIEYIHINVFFFHVSNKLLIFQVKNLQWRLLDSRISF